jgi:hypothetical protein
MCFATFWLREYDGKARSAYEIIISWGNTYRIVQSAAHQTHHHHHHQPINVPTAGAQAFLMDYT